ncbi:hypothetical protein [Bacillus yapensis]|nr:hypothetical protein [Bacillus yapensis]
MQIYGITPGKSSQYESNIYIAAVPYIYELIDESDFKPYNGPLVSLMRFDENKGIMVPSHAGLTGSTTWLVQAGFSLYNGNPCDLDYSNSTEFAQVFIQAFKIRNKLV